MCRSCTFARYILSSCDSSSSPVAVQVVAAVAAEGGAAAVEAVGAGVVDEATRTKRTGPDSAAVFPVGRTSGGVHERGLISNINTTHKLISRCCYM